jgi:hypothetical protein
MSTVPFTRRLSRTNPIANVEDHQGHLDSLEEMLTENGTHPHVQMVDGRRSSTEGTKSLDLWAKKVLRTIAETQRAAALYFFGIRLRGPRPRVTLLTAAALQQFIHVVRPPLALVPVHFLPDNYVALEIPAYPRFERNDHGPFDSYRHYEGESGYRLLLVFVFAATISILVLWGVLSNGFHSGASTLAQRWWIMSWLIVGLVAGVLCAVLHRSRGIGGYKGGRPNPESESLVTSSKAANGNHESNMRVKIGPYWQILILLVTYCAPAISGFVVIGQVYRQYGNCTSV